VRRHDGAEALLGLSAQVQRSATHVVAASAAAVALVDEQVTQAMQKLRTLTLGFGTARQKLVLE
jgi:hypothetical protein